MHSACQSIVGLHPYNHTIHIYICVLTHAYYIVAYDITAA